LDLIKPTRRGFLTASLALIAAPAIVRATSLMPIKSWLEPQLFEITKIAPNRILTIDMITREAVKLWQDSNAFLQQMESDVAKSPMFSVGDRLIIRRP
jgi:hypothetical protein